MAFSESLPHTHPYLAAARSKQSDPYRMTRIDILKSFQKANLSLSLFLSPPLWLFPRCDSPSFWTCRVRKSICVGVHPYSAEYAPTGLAVCFPGNTHKHTHTRRQHPVYNPPKQSLKRCSSPSVYLSVVDMDLKINKCPLSILLSSTPD